MDRRTVWAGLIAAVAIACSDAAGEMAGSMLVDAGNAMAGAGGELAGQGGTMAGVGGVIEDAGDMLAGVGGAMTGGAGSTGGGGEGDAMAQEPPAPTVLETSCNIDVGQRVDRTDPVSSSTTTYFYAAVDIGDRSIEDLAGAVFIFCNREDLGADPFAAADCPADATCTHMGAQKPGQDCYVQSYFDVSGSTVSASCGYHAVASANGSMISESGYRWNSVRLVMP